MTNEIRAGSLVTGPVGRGAADDLRLPGLLFILIGGAFLIVTMLAASIAPEYDFHHAAISDLGVIPETALLFNLLLVGIGALNLAGGYLLYRAHRRTWLLGLYAIAAIGSAGAGVFPLSTGGLHSIFALLAFVFFNLEAVATAGVVLGPMRVISAAAGIVGLIYVVVMILGDGGNPAVFGAIGHGGTERMIAYPAMIWLLSLGGYLLSRPREA
jgi:hypothetical membrane protein